MKNASDHRTFKTYSGKLSFCNVVWHNYPNIQYTKNIQLEHTTSNPSRPLKVTDPSVDNLESISLLHLIMPYLYMHIGLHVELAE